MSMQRTVQVVGEIVRKEFYQLRQDRRMLGVSLLAPVLQVLLLGYAATTDVTNVDMVVCDLDRTAESRALVQAFTTSGYFVPAYAAERLDEVDRYIEHARARVALVVPRGFGRHLLSRESGPLQMIFDGTDANSANLLLAYATQIVTSHARKLQPVYMMAGRGTTAVVVPEPRVWFNPDLRSSHFMVPGVVALVLMIITMTLTSIAIVKEKEIGTLEQLMVTPIKPHQLVMGKLVPFIIIGFVDMVAVLGIARFWFRVPLLGSIPLLFTLSGLFILTTLGLGLLISTIAKSQQQAMLIAQFFVFMPFMFLSGFAFPVSNMPQVIQYITYAIPLRYFLEIVRAVFLKGSGMAELWPQALALLLFGIAILTLSILRFRKKLE
jgi:ABC-2 type transport system permease protein